MKTNRVSFTTRRCKVLGCCQQPVFVTAGHAAPGFGLVVLPSTGLSWKHSVYVIGQIRVAALNTRAKEFFIRRRFFLLSRHDTGVHENPVSFFSAAGHRWQGEPPSRSSHKFSISHLVAHPQRPQLQ